VFSIINIGDIISALEKGVIDGREHLPAMKTYIGEYGANY
jgi:TRAP-type mannitol/chloroaromatic compound transport system substrate-binding protein